MAIPSRGGKNFVQTAGLTSAVSGFRPAVKGDSGEIDIIPNMPAPVDKAVLTRLKNATGLNATAYEINAANIIKLSIPAGADREAFVDKFIQTRNASGITKDEMGIADNAFGFKSHDPTGFYIQANDLTPAVFAKLEANKKAFQDLLPKSRAALSPTP